MTRLRTVYRCFWKMGGMHTALRPFNGNTEIPSSWGSLRLGLVGKEAGYALDFLKRIGEGTSNLSPLDWGEVFLAGVLDTPILDG